VESFIKYLMIVILIGIVLGAILLIRKTSKRFNLTDEQLARIKKRNQAIEQREKEENEK